VPGVLGCLQALEAIKILVGEKSHLSEHLLHCDFSTYELTKLKILKMIAVTTSWCIQIFKRPLKPIA
jgi:molybdopterin/thiamine biosynthesis adenylyltransferase